MIHPLEWCLRPEVRRVLTFVEEVIWDRGSTRNHCKQMLWQTTERLYVFYPAGGHYRLNDNRTTSDLWPIHKLGNNTAHCAPFPLDLAKGVLEIWSRPGELVCDPYSGSGTTAVAARDLWRKFAGAEILEKFWAPAQQRLQPRQGYRIDSPFTELLKPLRPPRANGLNTERALARAGEEPAIFTCRWPRSAGSVMLS